MKKSVIVIAALAMLALSAAIASAATITEAPEHIKARTIAVFTQTDKTVSSVTTIDMIKEVGQKNTKMNRWCIYALGQMKAHEAVGVLLKAMQSNDQVIARMAASALGKIGSEQAVAPLASLAHDETAPNMVRVSAIRALGRIGGPEAAEALVPKAVSGQNLIRRNATIALSAISN